MAEVSRNAKRSSTSFFVSMCVHLIVLLLLSVMIMSPRMGGLIALESSTNVATEDLESLMSVSIEFLDDAQSVEADLSEIETLPVEELTSELDSFVDFAPSELEDVSTHSAFESAESMSEMIARESGPGFFGIEATGNKIVYVIDMSPSMEYGKYERRYDRAVAEVLSSVDELKPDQSFFVYLFSFEKLEMDLGQGSGEFLIPTRENKLRLRKWLTNIRLAPGTDPRESVVAALKQKPSCVFLLSDGQFNGRRFGTGKYKRKQTTVELARRYNKSDCPIHTIGLEDEANQKDMTAIADQSKGMYKFVPAVE